VNGGTGMFCPAGDVSIHGGKGEYVFRFLELDRLRPINDDEINLAGRDRHKDEKQNGKREPVTGAE